MDIEHEELLSLKTRCKSVFKWRQNNTTVRSQKTVYAYFTSARYCLLALFAQQNSGGDYDERI